MMMSIWLKRGLLFLFGSIAFPVAYAGTGGAGVVTMNGEITDAACSIAMESQDQVIDMGVTPIGEMIQQHVGPIRNFDIYLINCDLAKASDPSQQWKTLQMTFDGPAQNGFFKVTGEARGIALKMQDNNQRQVIPGEPLPEQAIIPPNMRLSYTLRLVADNEPLRAGPYQSVIRFKVDYY